MQQKREEKSCFFGAGEGSFDCAIREPGSWTERKSGEKRGRLSADKEEVRCHFI